MVSSQQKEVFWVFDLVCQQQADGLQRLLASVYIIPQEQVVALWWKAPVFKQPQQIIILPMDITWGDKQTCIIKGETARTVKGVIIIFWYEHNKYARNTHRSPTTPCK